MDALEPPRAPRRPGEHQAHGVRRVDDFAWMRQSQLPEMQAYLQAERDYYDQVTAGLAPLREALAGEMVARTPTDDTSVGWRRAGHVYFTRTRRGEAHPRLFRVGPSGDEQLVLDPHEPARSSGEVRIGVALPSPDGRFVAYFVDLTGQEIFELRFKEIESGRDLPDRIIRTCDGGAWSADSTCFFYAVPDSVHRADAVLRHRLGSDPREDDVLVLAEPDPRFELTVRGSLDGAWVVLTARSRDSGEVHLVSAADPHEAPRLVAPRRDGIDYAVEPLRGGWDGEHDDLLLLCTNDGAPEFTLAQCPVPEAGRPGSATSWTPIAGVAPRPGERLESVAVLARHVVLTVRRDCEPFLRIIDRPQAGAVTRGPTSREVHAAVPHGQLALWRLEDPNVPFVLVVEQNLVRAPAWVAIDLNTGARTVIKRAQTPEVDPTRYVTERITAISADGTAVPITIAHRSGLLPETAKGCVLHAGGTGEACAWPAFGVPVLSLLDRDVVYAIAHVRGGGELGRHWWLEGRLQAKQHTFDDVIAARDALAEAGWAGVGVICRGLSAGSPVPAVAYSQVPQKWHAVIAELPPADVVTTLSDPSLPPAAGRRQEWGDPRRSSADFHAILRWSPYDNPPASGQRPPLLVTAAGHDPRVLVHEPAKWVAKLRAGATDETAGVAQPAGATQAAGATQQADVILLRVQGGAVANTGPSERFGSLRYEAEILAWALDQFDEGPDSTRL